MKYRIKTIIYQSGRKEFVSYVKKWHGWVALSFDGQEIRFASASITREKALERIDRHFNGNTRVQFIDFEYITK